MSAAHATDHNLIYLESNKMSTTQINPVILAPWFVDLLNAQIEITIRKDSELGLLFDLNLNAKSHLHMVHVPDDTPEGRWFAHMRYGEVRRIEDFDDLLHAALSGIHGRGFMHANWAELLRSHGHKLEDY